MQKESDFNNNTSMSVLTETAASENNLSAFQSMNLPDMNLGQSDDSKENLGTNDENANLSREGLKKFNEEILDKLKNESKNKKLQIGNLYYEIEEVRNSLKEQYGEGFYQLSQTANSISESISRLTQRSYKCVFKTFARQVEQSNLQDGNFQLNKCFFDKRQVVDQVQLLLSTNTIHKKIEGDLEKQIKTSIMIDIQIFVFILTQVPSIYVQFFNENFFEYLENIEILQETVNLHLCSVVIHEKILKRIIEVMGEQTSEYVISLTRYHLISFLQLVSSNIAKIFQKSKQLIQYHLDQFKEATENTTLTNRYVIIGLLKELSQRCKDVIIAQLSRSFFSLVEPDIIAQFATFVLQSNELFDLYYDSSLKDINQQLEMDDEELGIRLSTEQTADSEKPMSEQIQEKLAKVLQPNEQFQLFHIIRKDGHKGYLFELKNGKQYLMHKDPQGKLIIVNQKYMSNGWRKQDSNSNDTELSASELAAKESKADHFKDEEGKNLPPPNMDQSIYMGSAATNLGSSLGYCLANINKYKSTGAFLKDFGYIATVNGSITYMVQRIPVLGTLLLVGGLGFSTLKLAKDKVSNTKSKIGQAGKMALGTGTTLTGSISGAIIGQAAIPIPILGAFIGGVIGGIIGGKSSNYMIKIMNKNKFQQMITNIENALFPEGYWSYSRDMLNILGITNKFFQKSIPENLIGVTMDRQDLWMTLNCYGMLSSFYSQQEYKVREKLQKKLEDSESQEESQQIAAELEYANEWNPFIQKSQQWLLENNIAVVKYLKNIEEFVSKVVNAA